MFSLNGREVAQEEAVRKIFGKEIGQPANLEIRAVNGEWIDQYGFKFQAKADVLPNAAVTARSSIPGIVAKMPVDPKGAAIDYTTNLFTKNEGTRQIIDCSIRVFH